LATVLGLGSTPGFVINGYTGLGWGSYQTISNPVEKSLNKVRSLLGSNAIDYEDFVNQAIRATNATIFEYFVQPFHSDFIITTEE